MTYWAIREKLTERLMPVPYRGATRTEFSDHGPPRLFTTIGGAKTSLRMWCKGIWGMERLFESTNEYGDEYYYSGLPHPIGKNARDPSLYEIVEIQFFIKPIT